MDIIFNTFAMSLWTLLVMSQHVIIRISFSDETTRNHKNKFADANNSSQKILYFNACGATFIAIGNGVSDPSSNPGWDWLRFTSF